MKEYIEEEHPSAYVFLQSLVSKCEVRQRHNEVSDRKTLENARNSQSFPNN